MKKCIGIILPLFGILLFACQNQNNQPSKHDKDKAIYDTTTVIHASLDTVDMVQTSEKRVSEYPKIDAILIAILNDDTLEVSESFEYPILRKAPLPPIIQAENFRFYYPEIIDDSLKKRISQFWNNSDVIDQRNSNGKVGILNGLIWFDSNFKIVRINYTTELEDANWKALNEQMKLKTHPILSDYETLFFVGRTENLLIRIDETQNGYRYAQWLGNHNLNNEPDLIRYDGYYEKEGSGGNWSIYFDNGPTHYQFSNTVLTENDSSLGFWLTKTKNDTVLSNQKVIQVLYPLEEY